MIVFDESPSTVEAADLANDDYMSPRQVAFFRALLESQMTLTMAQMHAATSHEVETSADPNDQASFATDRMGEGIAHERAFQRLQEIQAALQRIDSTDYGYCIDSGDEIGFWRLAANPIATRSIEA